MATTQTHVPTMTPEEYDRFKKVAGVSILAAYIMMGSLLSLVQTDVIKLYPSNTTAESLSTFGERAEFAFRYQSLIALWLLFNICATIFGRLMNMALNPLEPKTEENMQAYKNILTNSFETLVLSILSQMVFISFAAPTTILRIIPLVNILNLIGRITFFAGYPMHRGFGFHTTIAPSIILVFYNIFKFGNFIGMY